MCLLCKKRPHLFLKLQMHSENRQNIGTYYGPCVIHWETREVPAQWFRIRWCSFQQTLFLQYNIEKKVDSDDEDEDEDEDGFGPKKAAVDEDDPVARESTLIIHLTEKKHSTYKSKNVWTIYAYTLTSYIKHLTKQPCCETAVQAFLAVFSLFSEIRKGLSRNVIKCYASLWTALPYTLILMLWQLDRKTPKKIIQDWYEISTI